MWENSTFNDKFRFRKIKDEFVKIYSFHKTLKLIRKSFLLNTPFILSFIIRPMRMTSIETCFVKTSKVLTMS